MTPETLRWREGRLELLDQRALPHRVGYLACDSAADVAGAIRDLVVRGAPAIGVAAAYGVALEALRLAGMRSAPNLEAAFAVLTASRPTAVNLFWALERQRGVWQAGKTGPPERLAQALLEAAHALCAEDVRINRELGERGAALLADGARVLTHCNAGALATAGHGTALGVIRSAVAQGKRIAVWADETRPVLQGARLTVWELQQDGIPVTLITDNMAGSLMRSGQVDAVIVGADRVAANGDVANKIGTYMVAVLARRHAIPFYVAAPLSTLDQALPSGEAIPIEMREAAEVRGWGETIWAPSSVPVWNPAFDVTPAELVTALITEAGVVAEPDRERLAGLLSRVREGGQ